MKIGLDIDDTILEFNEKLLVWHNEHYGTNYVFEDIIEYMFDKLWDCTLEEAIRRIMEEFYYSEHHAQIQLLPGAKSTLDLFADRGCSFVSITSRPPFIQELTLELLNAREVCGFVRHYFLGITKSQVTKADICHAEQVIFHVDDALHHAVAVAGKGIPVILLEKPWNKGSQASGIVRVPTWDDIQDEGLKIIRSKRCS